MAYFKTFLILFSHLIHHPSRSSALIGYCFWLFSASHHSIIASLPYFWCTFIFIPIPCSLIAISPNICIKWFKVIFTYFRALFCSLFTRLSACCIVDFVIQTLYYQSVSGSLRPLANRRFSFPALSVWCTVCNAPMALHHIKSLLFFHLVALFLVLPACQRWEPH